VSGASESGRGRWEGRRPRRHLTPDEIDERIARELLRPRTGHVEIQPQPCRWCRDTGYIGEGFMRCACTAAEHQDEAA
jgi:hypothetical protein